MCIRDRYVFRRYQYCSIGCTADSLIRQWENMPQNVSYVSHWQISTYSDAISTVLLVVRLIAYHTVREYAASSSVCAQRHFTTYPMMIDRQLTWWVMNVKARCSDTDAISTVLLFVRLIAWTGSQRVCCKMFRTCHNDRSVCIQMLSVLFYWLYGW